MIRLKTVIIESPCKCIIETSGFTRHGAKPTGKRHLGRIVRTWEDNIRIHVKGICINTKNWVNSSQDRDYW